MSRLNARALFIVVLMAFALSACSPVSAQLVDEDAAYTSENVDAILESIDTGDVEGRPVTEAEELRTAALVSLRNQGDDGTGIADLITATFPPDTRGVPVYAERATFNGQDAWVVIEVIGREGGTLEDMRLWVLSDDGEILYSANR